MTDIYKELPVVAGVEPRVFKRDEQGDWVSCTISCYLRDKERARWYFFASAAKQLWELGPSLVLTGSKRLEQAYGGAE